MSFVTRAIRADPILFRERDRLRLTYKAYKFTLFSSTHSLYRRRRNSPSHIADGLKKVSLRLSSLVPLSNIDGFFKFFH